MAQGKRSLLFFFGGKGSAAQAPGAQEFFQAGFFGARSFSAHSWYPVSMVERAVEMQIGSPGDPVEGAFVPDFHTVEADRIVAQFDLERPQGEVHLEEFFAQGDGAVLSHSAFGAGVKEGIDLVGLVDGAQGMARAGEALVRTHARGTVGPQVVGARDPAREGGVEFGQAVEAAAFEPQGELRSRSGWCE